MKLPKNLFPKSNFCKLPPRLMHSLQLGPSHFLIYHVIYTKLNPTIVIKKLFRGTILRGTRGVTSRNNLTKMVEIIIDIHDMLKMINFYFINYSSLQILNVS